MNLIPSHPHETSSKAEYRLFSKLKEVYSSENGYTAFHSMNLTRHKTKRTGEADFVILCKYGLFVLEVKGGGVEVKTDSWITINHKGEKNKIQNPFRQAEGAMWAIRDKILESGRFKGPKTNMPVGYGVVLPDIEGLPKSSEWDPQIICDRKAFRNCEAWFNKFIKYWRNKPNNQHLLSDENIRAIKQFLRPEFEIVESLHGRLDRIKNNAVSLTEDQYKYLDVAISNNRVLCSGGAGTGKTLLAAEMARRLASEQKNIVFVCKSSWLRYYLTSIITSEFVTVSTIESANIDRQRSGVESYDVLIVDEGQDLFDFDHMDILDDLVEGGLINGNWYIFHDINNQSGLFVETNPEVLDLLKSYSPVNLPLSTNCRNTSVILSKVQSSLNFDMGNEGTGIGPEVREYYASKENAVEILQNEIESLLNNEGANPQSITVLSPFCFNESLVSKIEDQYRELITVLDDYSIRKFPPQGISFTEIRNFKGLENEIIIITDLENPKHLKSAADKVQHYVAMSRARGLLCVIWIKTPNRISTINYNRLL
jgi:hypothetical protein